MKKNGKKNISLGSMLAIIVGAFFGIGIIVGGGLFVSTLPFLVMNETVIAVAAITTQPMSPAEPEPELPSALVPEPNPSHELLEPEPNMLSEPEVVPMQELEVPSRYTTITISAAGDTTLGGDSRWAGYHRFMHEFNQSGSDHSFFFRNVRDIFYESDLAIVNLEGALTYAEEHMDKQFVFRGPPHFVQILSAGAVDVVTIANNHTVDFFDRGYWDTIHALEAEGIGYFGNEFNTIVEVNGIQVGLFGFRIWNTYSYNRNRIVAAIEDLRERGAQLVIAYHHWGYENVNMANDIQRTMGRFTIENGADLVLGSHPHVMQGIEVYQGRNIVYSLGNFSFGGNSNPSDHDTFIFQQTFTFYGGQLMETNETNIIPARISSAGGYNNFQPTPAEGGEAERILQRLRTYSEWVN